MTFIIPIALVIVSGAGIFLIIRKKIPYLKKLEESGFEEEGNFFKLMFPEIFSRLERLDVDAYKKRFYNEYEKFLRRVKILSLKIDNYANKWLEGVASKGNGEAEKTANGSPEIEDSPQSASEKLEEAADELKKEEQSLIMEIAKNPKDVNLYSQLAEIYIKMGDKQDAEESLKTGLELDPENLKIKQLLGKI